MNDCFCSQRKVVITMAVIVTSSLFVGCGLSPLLELITPRIGKTNISQTATGTSSGISIAATASPSTSSSSLDSGTSPSSTVIPEPTATSDNYEDMLSTALENCKQACTKENGKETQGPQLQKQIMNILAPSSKVISSCIQTVCQRNYDDYLRRYKQNGTRYPAPRRGGQISF